MIDDGRPAVRAPDHLYTWLDVSEHFTALAEAEAWPRWLVEVDAYWDAARFVVSPSVEESTIWSWLTDVLGPLTVVPERRQLMLEDAGTERTLPVEIERAETAPLLDRRPRWTDRRVVASISEPLRPPASERLPHEMVLAAFHSFKGGVGRTLHCVAVARALASAGVRVLLVDADLEAPGITWMVSESLRIDFSFEDFLALVHGAADPNYHDAISLGRKFLANQELDGVVVMPARRDFERIAPPKIKPDDLLTADRGPYVLTEVLAELGHAIGAQVVLVDLRAGASELSAPLLLDPRVHRVLVTTISHQSVQGTLRVLQQLARRAPATREFDPDCTLLVTQFDEENHDTALASVVAQLRPAALAVSKTFEESAVDDATVDLDLAVPVLRSPFDPHLLSLPATWEDVLSRAQGANLGAHLRDLALALRSASQPEPPEPQDTAPVDINERRRRLADTADNLIYAEASAGEDFLATEPLRNLVEAHRTEVPIEVVIGGKGSGKTFTHLQLCTAASWDRFAEAAGVEGVTQRAPIVPVLASTTLRRERQEQLSELLSEAAARITGGTAAGMTGVRQFVQEHLAADTDELSWRRVWLAGLGRAVGLDTEPGRAERDLTELARHHQMIFVIDGLEDLFQEFTTNRQPATGAAGASDRLPGMAADTARPTAGSDRLRPAGHRPGRPPAELRTVREALSEVRPALEHRGGAPAGRLGVPSRRCPGRHRGGDQGRGDPGAVQAAAGDMGRQDGIAQVAGGAVRELVLRRALGLQRTDPGPRHRLVPRRGGREVHRRPTLAGPDPGTGGHAERSPRLQ